MSPSLAVFIPKKPRRKLLPSLLSTFGSEKMIHENIARIHWLGGQLHKVQGAGTEDILFKSVVYAPSSLIPEEKPREITEHE